jgi:UDP-N-acetylglucosamine--N-acetylmuramyl-(pentapeptide) pyrophosphoryl-undecaprenol N-acetylglucosamine transferase
VAGLQRRLDLRNLLLPFKIAKSLRLARKVIRDFGADVVVGFGGYASAPVLRAAQKMGIPTVVQEQNSYAGIANKMLARRARAVCVAYDGMERFFPADRIVFTGNPLRGDFSRQPSRAEALAHFGFTPDKPVLLVVGGSLGCRTFNEMIRRHIETIVEGGSVQVIWQTGKFYEAEMTAFMMARNSNSDEASSRGLSSEQRSGKAHENFETERTDAYEMAQNSKCNEASPLLSRQTFIDRMDLAYAAADLVISRSGANTVSELCLLGKATMFIPSPAVAEDHQTRNAMALVERDAAEICPDSEAVERAIPMALQLLRNTERLATLSANIKTLGTPDSADRVAEIVISNSRP